MKRNLFAGRRRSEGVDFDVLTADDLQDIHAGTLEVLDRTGVFVEDEEARAVFAGAGAEVDDASGVVRIPPRVVEEAIRTAPSQVVLCRPQPEERLRPAARPRRLHQLRRGRQGRGPVHGRAAGAHQGRRRPHRQGASTTCPTWTCTSAPSPPWTCRRTSPRCTRPRRGSPTRPSTASWARATATSRRSSSRWRPPSSGAATSSAARPIISFITCPVSPLKLVQDTCEIIMAAARGGVAVNILSHGHGRRLVAGHAGRHAGDAQRRGAGRAHAEPAHAARARRWCTAVPPPPWTSGSRRPPSARPSAASSAPPSPRSPASTCCPAGSPVRRATPKWSMPRVATRRP